MLHYDVSFMKDVKTARYNSRRLSPTEYLQQRGWSRSVCHCPDASHAEIGIGSGEDRPRKTHTSRVHRWCERTLSRARQSTSRFYSPGGRTEHRGFRGQPQLRSTSHPVNRLPSILMPVMRRALPRQTAFVGQCGWDLFQNPVGLCSWKDPQHAARLLGHVVVVGGHLMLVALKNLTVVPRICWWQDITLHPICGITTGRLCVPQSSTVKAPVLHHVAMVSRLGRPMSQIGTFCGVAPQQYMLRELSTCNKYNKDCMCLT